MKSKVDGGPAIGFWAKWILAVYRRAIGAGTIFYAVEATQDSHNGMSIINGRIS